MAPRPQPVSLVATLAVLAFLLVPLGAVIQRAEGAARISAADWAAIRFTLTQALLSAALSVALAVPVARALARRHFPLRGLLIALMGAPFILPVIVAIFGLRAVFGKSGMISHALAWAGLPTLDIYGFHGVILAHVFFNLPLATRMILQGWLSVPGERLRLAASLDLTPRQIRRVIEWPILRETAPGAFLIIFVICLSSFAVALTLGGGPRATTVELAIYQAFRFEFDLATVTRLALIQLGLSSVAALITLRIAVGAGFGKGLGRKVLSRPDAATPGLRLWDGGVLVLAAAFLLVPLASATLSGLPHLTTLPGSVWQAAGRSLLIATSSSLLCTLLALALAQTRFGVWSATLGLALSPLVLGTGLFLLIHPFFNPYNFALPVTLLVNALMGLPFATHLLAPALSTTLREYGPLAQALDLRGWRLWRWVILPRLARPLGLAAGLSAALSMGDLGVIVLFADPDITTLPLQMHRLMTAYQLNAASGAAFLLVTLSFGLYWLFDLGGRALARPD